MKDNYPIDFVVTWVNGNDKIWQDKKNNHVKVKSKVDTNSSSDARYRDWDIFKFWFRGVEKFAPWVNKVYLITDEHVPDFLKIDNPKLVVVDHKDYIPKEYLPTFSSHPIELNIHRIEGLSEHFVYFNDDMHLIDTVSPEDFFINGKPRSSAILNAITGIGHEVIQNITLNDVSIINKYFSKKSVIGQYKKNWYSLTYGPKLLRTFLLMPWNYFTGFVEDHLPNSYLKSTFEEVWEKEGDFLVEVSQRKFRDSRDVNQWLMKYWQLASNNFVPRSLKIGQHFDVTIDNTKACCLYISQKNGKMVCINDSLKDEDYPTVVKEVQIALNSILPDKSSFEN